MYETKKTMKVLGLEYEKKYMHAQMTTFCIGINLLILLDGQIVEHLGGKEKKNAKKI